MEDYIVGDVIKFWPRSGQYRAGKEEVRLPAGYRLIADMLTLRVGYVRWVSGYEEERVERAAMGFVRDGFQVPERESLGDTDPAHWPYPDCDPWQCVSLLGMINPETKQRFTYMDVSQPERHSFFVRANDTIANLCRLYAQKSGRALPIVQLKRLGAARMYRPIFEIVGWVSRTDVVAGR